MLEAVQGFLSWKVYITFIAGYWICLAAWRIWLCPLAKFPGPTLAALTRLYEAYFNVYKDGQFYKQMERLHEIYGPIVRISPYELHVKDPDWVSELYPHGPARRRDKYGWHTAEGTESTSSSTISHELHRARRAAVAASFSKASVKSLESLVKHNALEMVALFKDHAKTQQPIVLGTVFSKLTIDLVLQMWFGCEPGEVDRWGVLPRNATEAIPPPLTFSHRMRHFPWSFMHLLVLPASAIRKMPIGLILDLQKNTAETAKEALNRPRGSSWMEKQGGWKPVVQILQDSNLSDAQRSNDRIADEAFSFVMASVESTAQTLAVCLYHLLSNSQVLAKLRTELDAIPVDMDGHMALQDLEKQRYLRAVLDETLRINASVSGRLPRIAPDEDLRYGDWLIPRGTPVSMDHHWTHLDSRLYPDPYSFDPERWLDPETSKTAYRYLRPFGKGSRMCVGMHVADCEMLVTVATLVRRFDLELFETSRQDVDIDRDYLAGAAADGTKGVRVKVLGPR